MRRQAAPRAISASARRRTAGPRGGRRRSRVVRGVISRSTGRGSMLWVSGSMSQKTGVISCHCSAWAVATNVNDGHDHLAGQPAGADGDLQGDRAVAHGDAVADAAELGHPPPRTPATSGPSLVSQRRSRMSLDALEQAVAVTDVGAADVEHLREGGTPEAIARSLHVVFMVRVLVSPTARHGGSLSHWAEKSRGCQRTTSRTPPRGPPLDGISLDSVHLYDTPFYTKRNPRIGHTDQVRCRGTTRSWPSGSVPDSPQQPIDGDPERQAAAGAPETDAPGSDTAPAPGRETPSSWPNRTRECCVGPPNRGEDRDRGAHARLI